MPRHVLGGLTLLAAVLLLANARAVAPPRGEDDVQHLVYLSDTGPLLIRMHLRLDGQSFRSRWNGLMDELFTTLDVNRDGVLSKEEVSAVPPAEGLAGAGGLIGGEPWRRLPGSMTRQQLADHYAKTGLAPFQITSSPRQPGVLRFSPDGRLQGRPESAEVLNNRLFELLDRDKDGKLSPGELSAAPAILGKLDADEDEVLTADELRGQGGRPNDDLQQLVVLESLAAARGAGPRPFYLMADGPADRALALAILARYGKKGQKTLDARALGLSKERFVLLDRDGDGQLDQEELARLGPLTPDLELTVRLGKRGDKQPVVEVHRARPGLPARITPTAEGVTLELGTVALDLCGPQPGGQFAVDDKPRYVTQFRLADEDNNGYLDKAEAEKSPWFRTLFAVMDCDGDGMLFEKEMLAYFWLLEGLRTRAGASCVSLVMTDQGKGLFEMIDADGDGRLSVRELRRMAELVKKLDLDGDSKIARTEVPRRFRGAFERGPVGGGNNGFVRTVIVANRFEATPRPPARPGGPLWFRKMDRNRDGDLSRQEFLGTDADFKAIDADGDGLISAGEAERYDQARRKKTE